MAERRVTEFFRIKSGALGPVPECEIDMRPLTVFIGKQGTGKSLVCQMLYFFRELPFLVAYDDANRPPRERDTAEPVVRSILDGLRSSQRAFAVFANPSASIEWEYKAPGVSTRRRVSHWVHWKLGLSLWKANRRVRPNKQLEERVQKLRKNQEAPVRRAIFIPTERLAISQVRNPLSARVLSLPLTYTLFSDWMALVARTYDGWDGGVPDTPEGRWIRKKGLSALGGEASRWGDQWKWRFGRGKHRSQFDIDMASSGQRANWSLVLLAEALFSLREQGEISSRVSVYVEEPEIHLHPEAQVAMMEILAYLVKRGFRVVVTTHSLTVLYALNNLVQASRVPVPASDTEIPEEAVRLDPQDIAAYVFREDGVHPLVDRDSGYIDEAELGHVAEGLSEQMNRISMLATRPRRGRE